jgi:hypothetical protein
MDNLYSQGSISTEVLGVSFAPESGSDTSDTNGELTLGGTDSSKYSGSITYFSTLKSGNSAPYWGISIASFTYGSTTLASSAQGIVDTGTTLIYIPTSAYNKFLSAAGGKTDSSSGLAIFSKKPTVAARVSILLLVRSSWRTTTLSSTLLILALASLPPPKTAFTGIVRK